MSGTHAGILWIDGSVNQGGELQILANDNVKTVNFEPGKLIVFESDTMHKVLHYNGTSPRTSINVTMFCGDDNGN
jgi:predicted 2-oxoglutarate/Fe(II)-dependent dioxygenase YbiX